jgi:hypothetical protein
MPTMRRALSAALLALASACGGDTGDPQEGECEDYCDLVAEHCAGAVAQYPDRGSCLATCAAMDPGDPEDPTGDTVACRTFAAAAAELDSSTCPTAGPGGYGRCGTPCEAFCGLAEELCTGDLTAYADSAACLSACAAFVPAPPFDASDTGGDSFECRLYHLTAASVDPNLHCGHIGPVSPTCSD